MTSPHSVRSTYHRSVTAPIYQRRQHHPHPPQQQQQQPQLQHHQNDSMRLASLAGLSRIDDNSRPAALTAGLPAMDTVRCTLGASQVTSMSSRPIVSSPTAPLQGLFTPPQTPAASVSPTTTTRASSPRVISPSDTTSAQAATDNTPMPSQTYFPIGAYQSPLQQQQPTPTSWTPMAPSVSAASSSSITPSQLLRQSPQSEIKMEIETNPTSHSLLAALGPKFSSDSITIAAKKNNTLQIMADRWDQEENSHFEWLITLDRDADMSSVTAAFADGLLRVTVRRRVGAQPVSNSGSYRVVAPGYS